MGFPLLQLANRATERMDRMARMAMEPVVVFGGTRRGGLSISSGVGQATVGAWEESCRGDSDADADRTCAGRSAVLEAVLRATLESREWKRARDTEASERASGAGQDCNVNTPACNNDGEVITYGSLVSSPFRCPSYPWSLFDLCRCSTISPCLPPSI